MKWIGSLKGWLTLPRTPRPQACERAEQLGLAGAASAEDQHLLAAGFYQQLPLIEPVAAAGGFDLGGSISSVPGSPSR